METTKSTSDDTLRSEVATVRSFNRFFTRTLGVLRTGHLDSPWSLTEVRILYELLHRADCRAPVLRRALDMDAGQLSRVLTKLERDGLLTRSPAPDDARIQLVTLTDAGARAAAMLDDRATTRIRDLITPLPPEGRRRLVSAMTTVRHLLEERGERPTPTVVLRPPRAGDMGWVIERHGAVYFEEYGWDARFEALVAEVGAEYLRSHDPNAECAWVAEVDGERAGFVCCVRHDATTAKLRLLLVEPTARGLGVGGRLVEECLTFARSAGYRHMTLWTNDCLGAARRIYQRAGFHVVHSAPHTRFGPDLVGETWQRDL